MVFIPHDKTEKERLFIMQGPLWMETEFAGWYVVLSMTAQLSTFSADITHNVLLIPPAPPALVLH